MRPIPDCGDLMTLGIFLDSIRSGMITDADGFGNYATADRMSSKEAVPSEMTCGFIDDSFTHIV